MEWYQTERGHLDLKKVMVRWFNDNEHEARIYRDEARKDVFNHSQRIFKRALDEMGIPTSVRFNGGIGDACDIIDDSVSIVLFEKKKRLERLRNESPYTNTDV